MKTYKSLTKSSIILTIYRLALTCICFVCLSFIFSNSAQVGQVSSSRSEKVTQVINEALEKSGSEVHLTQHQVRKTAHFFEYSLLGFIFMLTAHAYGFKKKSLPLALSAGFIIGAADEYLQSLVPGRNSSLTDVLIDFSGFLSGALGALILIYVFTFLYNKYKTEPNLK